MKALAERHDRHRLEQLPDLDVAKRVLAGEPALFELIMRRYNRRLFRIARGILGEDAEAEDAVQDAYVKAYFRLGQFRGPDGFATWLCRITSREALMRRRARSRARLTTLSELDLAPSPEATMADVRSTHSNPEAGLHERQLYALMEQAIDALPEAYRSVFMLRAVEQMTVAETAQCLDLEEATVKTRLHRARRRLQQGLSGELSAALTGVFDFDGERCDRLVRGVFQRIGWT